MNTHRNPLLFSIKDPDGNIRIVPMQVAVISIGRTPQNQILLDHPEVSRNHARIELVEDGYQLIDLGSANGTLLNQTRLAPKTPNPIHFGDEIQIGPYLIEVREDSSKTGVHPSSSIRDIPIAQPIVVVETPEWTRQFTLGTQVLRIGRLPDAEISIPDPEVSGKHAEIRPVTGGYDYVDVGSRNGSYIAGKPIQVHRLREGDVIHISSKVTIQFHEQILGDQVVHDQVPVNFQISRKEATILKIGRDISNEIFLDHPQVSRFHAQFEANSEGTFIHDLDSLNGTTVNGRRIQGRVPVKLGDKILIGPFLLEVTADGLKKFESGVQLRLDAVSLRKPVSPDIVILKDVSLSIQPGEFVAIVGGSGSGKTTLVDALSGLRPAPEGSVFLNGEDLYQHFDSYRSLIGYVPQDDIIHLDLTVSQALSYAAELSLPPDTSPEERQERVQSVLKQMGLEERSNTRVRRLSGGQRKRVSIGVELLTKPSLFFLDEPTSGLDPGMEARMMQLLRGLADQGTTVIVITHATQNVMMCDKVVIMGPGGYLTYFGPPEEALSYFGVQEFVSVYQNLESEDSARYWSQKFLETEAYNKWIYEPLLIYSDSKPISKSQSIHPGHKNRRISAMGQFLVLSRRYVRLLWADLPTLLVLLAQAPLVAFLLVALFKHNIFDPTPISKGGLGDARHAMLLIYNLAVITAFFGISNSAKEIVKEAPIYRRERMVFLKIMPYILSKFVILSVLCLLQCAILLGTLAMIIQFPPLGVSMYFSLLGILFLTAAAGLGVGLLTSSVVSGQDTAISLVPILMVPNLMFSGTIVTFVKMGIASKIIALVTLTKWSMEAMGKVVNLNELFVQQDTVFLRIMATQYKEAFDGAILPDCLVLVLFIIVCLAGIYVSQWRKDSL